jgi:hypothetical protein
VVVESGRGGTGAATGDPQMGYRTPTWLAVGNGAAATVSARDGSRTGKPIDGFIVIR